MGYFISFAPTSYIYQPSFGSHTESKGYKHHEMCGLCGNKIDVQWGKEIILEHIKLHHSDKLLLLEDEDSINDEYTNLLNIQDHLQFQLFKLELIESSLNGMYKGKKHPRFNATFMNDNQQVLKYQLARIKEKILSYDLNHNSFVPIMSYENLDGLN
jgi:hypothetical protein